MAGRQAGTTLDSLLSLLLTPSLSLSPSFSFNKSSQVFRYLDAWVAEFSLSLDQNHVENQAKAKSASCGGEQKRRRRGCLFECSRGQTPTIIMAAKQLQLQQTLLLLAAICVSQHASLASSPSPCLARSTSTLLVNRLFILLFFLFLFHLLLSHVEKFIDALMFYESYTIFIYR